jgi:N-acetyl-alpha-D-glucosaminyl L-malate synthase BshA
LHVHYAVPHATAAFLAVSMLPVGKRPKVITTLHGTDTTLLGRDPGYAPAVRHALEHSDAITTVSEFMRTATIRVLGIVREIEVIHNFFNPLPCSRTRADMRREVGVRDDELMLLHISNLRALKRIDLLLETVAKVSRRRPVKLVVLAGDDFAPFAADVRRLGLENVVVVRERVAEVENYLGAADLGLFTSETESFCLSILELMSAGVPSVAFAVGGIPEVVESGRSGILVPFGKVDAMADAVESLAADPAHRARLGAAARERAATKFSAAVIVPKYEAVYRRVCGL